MLLAWCWLLQELGKGHLPWRKGRLSLPRPPLPQACQSLNMEPATVPLLHGPQPDARLWECPVAGQCCLCLDIFLPTTGDHFYKRNKNLPPEEQMISALPDIKVLTINDDHDFMVIACDGIW